MWLFPVSQITLENCMGPPLVIFEPCNMFGKVKVLILLLWSCPKLLKYLICSCNDISIMDLPIAFYVVSSQCSSFFLKRHILLVFNITGKILQKNKLVHRFLSRLALNTSFIRVNASHLDLILCKIFSIHVSAHIHHLSKVNVLFHLLDPITSPHYTAMRWYILGKYEFIFHMVYIETDSQWFTQCGLWVISGFSEVYPSVNRNWCYCPCTSQCLR